MTTTTAIPVDNEGNVPISGTRVRKQRMSLPPMRKPKPNTKTLKYPSQEDIAKLAQISRSYLAEIEQGRKLPRPLVAQSLAEALQTDVWSLLPRGYRS